MLPEDVLGTISEAKVRWVQLNFPDLYGVMKNKTISSSKIGTSSFVNGVLSPEVSEVFGEIYEEDLVLVPDADTYGTIAWADSTARMVCSIKKSNKERYLKDPTYPLDRANELFKAALGSSLSVEQRVEFYLLDGASIDKGPGSKAQNFPGKEATWNSIAMKSISPLSMAGDPLDSYSGVRQQIVNVLTDFMRYSVKAHGHGRANNSQQFLVFDESNPIQSAHALSTLRMVARAVSIVNVAIPTFMALPFYGEASNNYVLSFASYQKGKNLFYDAEDELALSQEGRYFIGGILEHLPSLMAFTNSTINSYRRLAVEPKYSSAGQKDRYNSILTQPSQNNGFNIHAIFPDPLANPYFALAAIISAGVDGIKKKIEPHILTESPLVMSEAQRRRHKVKELPRTLLETLHNLESDNEYLKGIFSTDIVYAYTEAKANEIKEDYANPSTFDYEQYFHL